MSTRKLCTRKSYADLCPDVSLVDVEPIHLVEDINLDQLIECALEREEPDDDLESPLPTSTPLQSSDSPSSTKQKRLPSPEYRNKNYRNAKCRLEWQAKYERNRHLGGCNSAVAVSEVSDTSRPVHTGVQCEDLPFAAGFYLGVDTIPYRRTVKRTKEYFEEHKFRYVQWEGEKSISMIDKHRCIIVAAVKKCTAAGYQEDLNQLFDLVDEAHQSTRFMPAEKKHQHSNFPALAYGISFGKGQPRLMRLGGKHHGMMKALLDHCCFNRIAVAQSAAYTVWSPKNYDYYRHCNHKLYERLLDLEPNFPCSEFSCMTVNFGPQVQMYIHVDSKNTVHGMCAVTAGGNYNHKLGGHLILWDLKVVIEFPPGCTIILPSALIHHLNIPVQPDETQYSIMQYTAGGIWRWLDAGGKTDIEIKKNGVVDEMKEVLERKNS